MFFNFVFVLFFVFVFVFCFVFVFVLFFVCLFVCLFVCFWPCHFTLWLSVTFVYFCTFLYLNSPESWRILCHCLFTIRFRVLIYPCTWNSTVICLNLRPNIGTFHLAHLKFCGKHSKCTHIFSEYYFTHNKLWFYKRKRYFLYLSVKSNIRIIVTLFNGYIWFDSHARIYHIWTITQLIWLCR